MWTYSRGLFRYFPRWELMLYLSGKDLDVIRHIFFVFRPAIIVRYHFFRFNGDKKLLHFIFSWFRKITQIILRGIYVYFNRSSQGVETVPGKVVCTNVYGKNGKCIKIKYSIRVDMRLYSNLKYIVWHFRIP